MGPSVRDHPVAKSNDALGSLRKILLVGHYDERIAEAADFVKQAHDFF